MNNHENILETQNQTSDVQASPETPKNPDVNTDITTKTQKKPNKLIKPILVGLLIIILISGGVALGVYLTSNNFSFMPSETEIEENEIEEDVIVEEETTKDITEDKIIRQDEIVWLNKQVELFDLKIIKELADEEGSYVLDGATFYKTATLTDGSELINAFYNSSGMGGNTIPPVRVIKDNSGKYSIITSSMDDWSKNLLLKQLEDGVSTTNIIIEELNPPDAFTVEGEKLNKGYQGRKTLADFDSPKKVYDSPYGTIYTSYSSILDTNNVYARVLLLELPDKIVIPYTPEEKLLTDDQIAKVVWTDGRDKESYTQAIISSCGSGLFGSTPVLKSDSPVFKDYENVGNIYIGSNKTYVFQIKNKDNELVKALYEAYKTGRDYQGGPEILAFEEFVSKPNHFLWKDSLGDWQIYSNSEYSSLAECGKPVIYLYPQSEMKVKVSVDAKVRISEPKYPDGGWLVFAKPDGMINYQGSEYDSLYWEGLGSGTYPDFRKYGEVVSQDKLLSTLYSHLLAQGLNIKEADDFMEFWTPKLPTTPYVRLTWLGTREMNHLAPLTIDPNPDSLLRVFLEFEGLQEKIELIPQQFSKFKREGFSVIEWGGLLTVRN